AVVDEGFLEIQEAAVDVAEVDVEDLAAAAEITDHVVDLLAGFFEHLGNGALAEIQTVIFAGDDVEELLEAIRAAQNAVNASEAFVARHAGVVRMARHADLVFLSYRDYAFQEIGDALPGYLFGHWSGLGERRVLLGFRIDERAVARAAAAGRALGAHYAENRHVVFQRRNAG